MTRDQEQRMLATLAATLHPGRKPVALPDRFGYAITLAVLTAYVATMLGLGSGAFFVAEGPSGHGALVPAHDYGLTLVRQIAYGVGLVVLAGFTLYIVATALCGRGRATWQ